MNRFRKAALLGLFVGLLIAAPSAQGQLIEPNKGGKVDLRAQDPAFALSKFKTAPGYQVNLFASEKNFPVADAVAMQFDAKGRLWVACMPSYPHYLPGVPPDDKLIILEDANGDGKADSHKVFADKLYLPTGFEFGEGGVFVAAQPNLLFLKDTDGDDRADVREIVLHGFGTEDSHHAVHAFTRDPGGGLYFMEGTFHHSQVETPHGTVRLENAGIFRYEPRTQKLDVYVSYGFANPWGHVFDRWGQNFIADASGGSNYFALPITGRVEFPRKHPTMKEFTNTKVRPTCGCEIVSSRHFPDDVQGDWLLNNCIGFQGIKHYRIVEKDSGFEGIEVEPLLQSFDGNFRPVDIKFGPDGALYIVDWFNPLVGHMQYSLRDERRDHSHGRIWRITYPSRPLIKPTLQAGKPIPELLEQLKSYEDRTRYRARQELGERDPAAVLKAADSWIAAQDSNDPQYEHNLLEGLWVHQWAHEIDEPLLNRLLSAKDHRARAGAARVLRYWLDQVSGPIGKLKTLANDPHPRVRLEAVVASSVLKSSEGAEAALESLKHPMDDYLNYGLTETMTTLEPHWKPAIATGKPFASDNPAGLAYALRSMPAGDLIRAAKSEPVYVAMLDRAGITPESRAEAVRALAKIRKRSEPAQLLDAMERLDQAQDADGAFVLLDLGVLLTRLAPAELASVRDRLERMATQGRQPQARQLGYVGLILADGSGAKAFGLAERSALRLRDLLDAVPLVPDAALRNSLDPSVRPLLRKLPPTLATGPGGKGTRGRFVRVEMIGTNRILTLAEVEVWSRGVNIARQGKASQSSVTKGGSADLAIDGVARDLKRQTHTDEMRPHPWWEVDLLGSHPIEAVVIWAQSDGRLVSRLEGFALKILDDQRRPIFEKANNPAPDPSLRFEMEIDQASLARQSAISAIVAMTGNEAETFRTLAELIIADDERAAAVRALRRLPKSKRVKESAPALARSLLAYADSVRAEDRALPEVRDALRLVNDLAVLLPADQAQAVRAKVGELGVAEWTIRTVPHKMVYDRKEIAVQAGKPFEIVFENLDIMPHNLLITQPGARDEVAALAERMATQSDAFAKGFVPDSDKILKATPLIAARETVRLTMAAPTRTGDYPYVCTFPGHAITMNGVIHVVDDVERYLAANPIAEPESVAEARPFVRDWTLDELAVGLDQAIPGRGFARGKEVFAALSCVACHRVNGVGGNIGPDLGTLDPKIKPQEILESIVHPSRKIDDKHRTHLVLTADGKQYSGLLIEETETTIKLMPYQPNQAICEVIVIAKEDVEERKTSQISLMPEKLLSTATKEEILDLIAYLQARGKP